MSTAAGGAAPAVRDNAAASRLEAGAGGELGYAEYLLAPGTITFTHTRVPASARGHGVGTQLIEAGLELARRRGLKVIPKCPFFATYMRTHPETHELLALEGRRFLDAPGT